MTETHGTETHGTETHGAETHGGRPATDRSVAELVSDATDQVSTLVRDEIRLAVTEMQQKGRRLGVSGGLLGGSAILALYGGGAVVIGLILLLATVLTAWQAAFIVGGGVLLIAAITALVGKKQAERAMPPLPERTAANVRQDIEAIKKGAER